MQLKAEIANLTRLAEAGSALSSGEEAALNELMKQKEELTRERDAQVSRSCYRAASSLLVQHSDKVEHPSHGTGTIHCARGLIARPCTAAAAVRHCLPLQCN